LDILKKLFTSVSKKTPPFPPPTAGILSYVVLVLVLSLTKMPLVKLFARHALSKPINLASLQSKLCNIWGTKPNTTKLILTKVDDWTDESFREDVYVDIRAYGKDERTREMVLDGMQKVQVAFKEEGLIANVRLETYDGERYFHVPPKE